MHMPRKSPQTIAANVSHSEDLPDSFIQDKKPSNAILSESRRLDRHFGLKFQCPRKQNVVLLVNMPMQV